MQPPSLAREPSLRTQYFKFIRQNTALTETATNTECPGEAAFNIWRNTAEIPGEASRRSRRQRVRLGTNAPNALELELEEAIRAYGHTDTSPTHSLKRSVSASFQRQQLKRLQASSFSERSLEKPRLMRSSTAPCTTIRDR